MTQIYLAFSISGEARMTYPRIDQTRLNMLVAYPYLEQYDSIDPPITPVKTILDSGAYSAFKSGIEIDIDALTAETVSGRWGECVALDIIGDPDGSLKNALYMKAQGSPAYPVFHIGEPYDLLKEYCRQFTKVGLSCRLSRQEPYEESFKFLDHCFGYYWPHKFHSFGWIEEKPLMRYPFHSADTASWNNKPGNWGRFKAFKGLRRMKGTGCISLLPEVEYYWRLQDKLVAKWQKELDKLEVSCAKPARSQSQKVQAARAKR